MVFASNPPFHTLTLIHRSFSHFSCHMFLIKKGGRDLLHVFPFRESSEHQKGASLTTPAQLAA
jgi:hypothetical protein